MLQQHFSVLVIEIQDGMSHPAFRSSVVHGYGGHPAARFQSFEDHHSWFDVAGWLQTFSDFFLSTVSCTCHLTSHHLRGELLEPLDLQCRFA